MEGRKVKIDMGKRCDCCSYTGKGHYQPVEGYDICPRCYNLWASVRADAYEQFRKELKRQKGKGDKVKMIKPLRATLDYLKIEVGEIVEMWYNQGYADGYNAAIGKPAVKLGGTTDQKELEEVEGDQNETS